MFDNVYNWRFRAELPTTTRSLQAFDLTTATVFTGSMHDGQMSLIQHSYEMFLSIMIAAAVVISESVPVRHLTVIRWVTML